MSGSAVSSLGDHFETFIETQIEEGRFQCADDVLRAGLKLLEQQQATLSQLRAALIEGEQSGPSAPFDFDAFLASKIAESASD